jgi:glutathione reductase (NADPH)
MSRYSLLRKVSATTTASALIGGIRMSSTSHAEPEPTPIFDLLVVGGGSGGIACAKRSSSYGANVAIVENARWGGTCVNVGCVPKKIMFNASHVAETIKEAHHFGFKDIGQEVKFDWLKMKTIRDRYIGRLNGIYSDGLEKLNVTRILGEAKFTGLKTVCMYIFIHI